MLIPFQARNGAAYSDPGSSLDLPRFSLGSVYWIYAVDKLNKPANKAGWKEAVLFYAFDKKTMFITFKLIAFVQELVSNTTIFMDIRE
ncbi:Uncharacterised protein [Salmonella enterica subsp. enterica serovar Typhi]|jgi:hypothetical protein|nr:Uncharacterised protein [Salmonella enterica subsp. enterica serovar Typhi]CFZ91661.1 Uncharacterised protein [Salmonella enterica subsp. enterica serovar Typhi]CGU16975.1 Uncharacterised protein [Salmonella enterica subsp. enterica serovar Typhi]CHS94117.1 Uncharacterised protein [Salmonella enterica subsp. enterica serovar Typhi]CHW60852.1 Uncharacterised protein [Salmonella enterica subsp. enterica serovar Typhi]